VAVVTRTTQEIEARISNEVWDRQKRWELKREVLLDATKRIAELDQALTALNAIVRMEEEVTTVSIWPQSRGSESNRLFSTVMFRCYCLWVCTMFPVFARSRL